MAPITELHAAQDDVSDYAQRFAPIPCHLPDLRKPTTLMPSGLAAIAIVPRRNLCAEFSKLPTDMLLVEAEEMLVRLDRAGRPTDYAIVTALLKRVDRAPELNGTLWLDLPAVRA